MASELVWKVRDGKTLVASCREPEAAAAMTGLYPSATVHFGHTGCVVWRAGAEAFPACDSWDNAADVMRNRARTWQEATIMKNRARCLPQYRVHLESCADVYCKGCKEPA